MEVKSKALFELEICGKDSKMRVSFEGAGLLNQISEECLEMIDKHDFVIYLKGETGSFSKATEIAKAGAAILKTCGLGIKVETAGKAFEKEHWIDLLENGEDSDLLVMFVFVAIADGYGNVFSCGMHNLGLKDTILKEENEAEALEILSIFGYYKVVDKPIIKPKQTFALSKTAPIYRILEEEKQPYQGEELLENPFGMWRLEKIKVS